MAYDFEKNVKARVESAEIDLGLKAYMNKVYSFMAFGSIKLLVFPHIFSLLFK